MILKDLLENTEHEIARGNGDIDITGLAIDSRIAHIGDLFIAVKGYNNDGHDFIAKALEKEVNAVIIDEDRKKSVLEKFRSDQTTTLVSVNDTRDILSKISNRFYGYPAEKFNLIGVTGTNGKTSVTIILNYVLKKLGHKTGLIGTIANYCGDEILDIRKTTPTTPDCIELAQMMSYMAENKVDDVIMEVSSMGIKTGRVKDLIFDLGIMTNISQDHLDDHITMKDYVESKLILFSQSKKSVVNMDDEYAQDFVDANNGPCVKYGIRKKDLCDLTAESISFSADGVDFRMMYGIEQFMVNLKIPSEFAIYNVLAVTGACLQLGIPFKELKEPIQDNIEIPGRYDVVVAPQGFTGIIDYAHTEVALENLLQAVKANPSYNKLISVFGCGGDRDPGKREPMGKVSGKIADYTIVTSDNPRTEDPLEIIKMIVPGVEKAGGKYEIIPDRKEAIIKAVEMAEKDDVIVIAGKGHENYQILKDTTIDFDDKEIFNSLI